MYKKNSHGWLKHYDFIILDLLCLQIAFVVAFFARFGISNPYGERIYCELALFLMLIDVAVLFFNSTFSSVMRRGYYKEFVATVKHSMLVFAAMVILFFIMKESATYSRALLFLTWGIYAFLSYVVRVGWKIFLRNSLNDSAKHSLFVITSKDEAERVVRTVQQEGYINYTIQGLAVVDEDMKGESVLGVPVVAGKEDVSQYICKHWVDEVLIRMAPGVECPKCMIDEIVESGVTIHEALARYVDGESKQQKVERVGGFTVITTSMKFVSEKQAFYKRSLDIVGGIVGCLIAMLIIIIVGPMIYIASPGPILFSQVRVGKNGKKFKIYKLRSMYMDAEERKKELMASNRIKDGMMFKMDFDPRIIGNKILPDGTKKTGIGDFIRRTSLDEFPQFWNVLKGDMSLVGTRPPTLDEWEKYERHHRVRLATKPGITGMWQVSGRSKIVDFEEVVRLDTKYINEWDIGLDIKLLLKTVVMVVKQEGSM